MSKVLVVGSSVVDLTFYSKAIPLTGQTVIGRFVQGLGGKGFNQAVAARLAGVQTAFVSALGEDSFAPLFKDKLNELGIESFIEQIKGVATGAASISVDEQGKNSIIVALGASEKLTTRHLSAQENSFQNTDVLLMQFETNLEVVDAAIKLARKANPDVVVILNPAPALDHVPTSILEQVDFLTPNETELEAISGVAITNDASLREACERIKVRGAVLATLGERGSYFFRRSGALFETDAVPACRVRALDTAGAGDAFNGAFAAALAKNPKQWKSAAAFATRAAAISVTRPGTSSSMATLKEIEEFRS